MATDGKSGKNVGKKGEQNNREQDGPPVEFVYRTGHLFVLDATPEMFNETGGLPESYFLQCLMTFERILRQKLSMSRDDWMGLILFATKESDPAARNIRTLIEFGEVSIQMLTQTLDIIRHEMDHLITDASDEHYPLANVLLHAGRVFDAVNVMMPLRQVVLLTCHDNPVPEDEDERHRARVNAKSYRDIHVILKTVGLGDDWNYNLFYEDLEMLAAESCRTFKETKLIDLETLATKRATNIGNLKLKIGNNYVMKVQLNALVKRRRQIETCLLNRETNEPLNRAFHFKKVLQPFEDDEDEPPEETPTTDEFPIPGMRKFHKKGGADIFLTLEELKSVGKLKERGIEIIRFEPALEKDPIFHIQLPFFLVPPEDASKSQRLFFAALLERCRAKNVMAICAATVRDNTKPRLFRMWPGEDMNGFYFYRIPYTNEVNNSSNAIYPRYAHNRDGNEYPVDPEKLQIMKKVIKKFKIAYTPHIFPNPVRAKRIEYLQCLALHEDIEPNSFEDYTKPAMEIFEMKLKKGGLLEQYNEALPPSETQLARDRKVIRYDDNLARDMLQVDSLNSYTVPQLKAIAKALGLACGGLKSDIIKRLEDFKARN